MGKVAAFILLLTSSVFAQISVSGAVKTSGGAITTSNTIAGTAISSCQNLAVAGTYYLTQDISSAGSCIGLRVSGITLNLNGHTITYGTSSAGWTYSVTAEPVVRSASTDGNGNGIDTLSRGGRGSQSRAISITKISNTNGGPADYVSGLDYANTQQSVNCGWSATTVTWCVGHGGTKPVLAATYYVDYTYQEPICGICSVATFDTVTAGDLSMLRFSNTLNTTSICCGTITETAGAPPYSDPIRIGQQNNTIFSGLNIIANMTLNFASVSGAGFYGNGVNNFIYYNNTINNTGTLIYNRSAEEAFGVFQSGATGNAGPSTAAYNTINGGPQGGIRIDQNYSKMHHNTISLTATFTNSPALYPYSNNSEVYSNTVNCHTGSNHCRGIISQGDGSHGDSNVIHDNVVHARDNNQNYEYGTGFNPGTPGCELFGAYGIQFDTTTNATAYSNTVTGEADVCDGRAMRITGTVAGSNNVTHDNSFSGVRQGSSVKRAVGLSVDCAANYTSTSDTFIGDTYPILMDIDGAKNILLISPTIQKGTNPDNANFKTVYIEDKGFCSGFSAAGDLTIRDATFGAGTSVTDYFVLPTNSGGIPFNFFAQWTYTPTYTSGGLPLSGATVTITNALSAVVYTGTTDVNGQIPAQALNQFRGFNTTTTQSQENQTPHSIAVTKGGCTTLNYSVSMTAPLTESRAVSCP
ncbi:MAG: hypothetical protein JWO13_839 [Acidobacteriales bacterium]|nr:hypothetical protein [Terriglobales bacterium]